MKKRVFISGITGVMGGAGLSHLLKYEDELDIISLVRDSKKNRKKMDKYKDSNLELVWGDLRSYGDVKRALEDVDYILHLAALVSPGADHQPKKAWDVNVGSIDNILRAIEELGLDDVKLIYIGSVAQTGSRLPPIHRGRVGDPLKTSLYDNYAHTKIAAERKVIESGLKYWVSLRQTGILHYGLLSTIDDIIFHQPLNNVLEWITEDDSGRLLANICRKELPDNFWKNIYNIGGGKDCRMNNYDFMSRLLKVVGVNDIEEIYEPYWFANRNFHGQYYLDSYILDEYLDFRRESIDDFANRYEEKIEFPVNILKYLPASLIKNFVMKPLAHSKGGSMRWIKDRDMARINAFWGSLENWEKIKTWDDIKLEEYDSKFKILDHGYDEEKPEDKLSIEDMKEVAIFRGGKLLSLCVKDGDLDTKLKWRCAFGHEFYASPRLVLKAGHYCSECMEGSQSCDKIAEKNRFFGQVWEG